jgi:uncharacterized protein
VVGQHGDAIKVRIAAPPVEGAANRELVLFLAKHLKVRRSSIRIVGGENARRKVIEVDNLSAPELARRLLPGTANARSSFESK